MDKPLLMICHREYHWNRENWFTEWTDVPLNDMGIFEAVEAGRQLNSGKV
jgi:2,3-bisphosphoglycerate-dependent phosphoglycerate mutase